MQEYFGKTTNLARINMVVYGLHAKYYENKIIAD